jgi:mRNA-degrading endonuclease toxin of MazEF toxin-antitoxin module
MPVFPHFLHLRSGCERERVAVNVQGLASFDRTKLARKLGTLTAEQYGSVKVALRDLLGL